MKRCLMLATSSLARVTGYSIRVWLALQAVTAVQGAGAPAPVLVTFESLRDWLRPAALRAARQQAEELGVSIACFPLWPKKLPGSGGLNRRWCAALVRLAAWWYDAKVVHAQSHMAAVTAARALRWNREIQVVFDVHGVDIEERLADGRLCAGSRAHQVSIQTQREAIRRADWIFPVSEALRDYLQADPHRSRVVPCVASLPLPPGDPEYVRQQARDALAVDDRPVVLYLGGASDWQRPEYVVRCFSELLKIVPDAVMLVISGDKEKFSELLQDRNIPSGSCRVVSLPHKEVGAAAAAADLGLLLREDTLVNRVASPTKFAEYLALGVPVVLTDALADFAEIVRNDNVGRVVGSSATAPETAAAIGALLEQSRAEGERIRRRCRESFARHMSFDSILPAYAEIYGAHKSRSDTLGPGRKESSARGDLSRVESE